jgi:hypothetical protein
MLDTQTTSDIDKNYIVCARNFCQKVWKDGKGAGSRLLSTQAMAFICK